MMTLGFLATTKTEEYLPILMGFGGIIAAQWLLLIFYTLIRRSAFDVEALAFFLCTLGMAAIASVKPSETVKQLIAMGIGILLFLFLGWSLRDLQRAKRIRYLAVLAGAVLAVIFQWRLRVNLFRRRLHAGDTNRQTLARWVALERLCRLLKEAPGEEYLTLAQKAKYSQYAITDEELATMDMALEKAQKRLKKNLFMRLYCAVILAIDG
jgi:hypothetical protein